MCDPTIIAGTGLLLNVIGGQQQAAAQAGNMRFDASVAATNAATASQAATDVMQAGADAERVQLRRVAALTGRQRVAYAAGNVDSSSGSALDVIAESAAEGTADATRIRSNAIREAWGYQTQAAQENERAAYLRAGAKQAKRAGLITGLGTAAGGLYKLGAGGGSGDNGSTLSRAGIMSSRGTVERYNQGGR